MASYNSSTVRLLVNAARCGNVERVHRLIEDGACVNAVDKNDRTALMIVAKEWWIEPEIAISLINGGTDVNIKDKCGKTAVMYAIETINEDTAIKMIKHSKDLDLNAVDNRGQTALMTASIKGMTTCALELIKRDADVNLQDKYGITALVYAMEYRRDDIADAVIKKIKDFNINSVDIQGQTALMKAANKGMTTCVLELIKRGADVNVQDKYGITALMHAIDQANETTALAMIEHSKDLDSNVVDNQGQTALMRSALLGMIETALELIKRDADVNLQDKYGATALVYAMEYRRNVITDAVIRKIKDFSVNSVDIQGQTALMKAAINGMTTCALELIKRGADVNEKDKEGKTALMHAIDQGYEDTALAIIEHSKDLDLNAADNQGQTVLMITSVKRMTSYSLEFIKRGADVNVKDKEGKTALMHAIDQGNEDAALAIIEHSKDLDLNAADNQGQTVLMITSVKRMTSYSLELIKRGADVNVKDKEGKTALMYDIDQGNEDTALAIIEHSKDLDLNAANNQGQTVLMTAAAHGMTKVVHTVIKREADVNIKDQEGKTALMYAISYSDEDTADAILNHSKDLDLNAADYQGKTALMTAAAHGMTKVILFAVIKREADVNIKDDKEGKTALMHAIDQGNEDTALAIIKHSKDLDLNAVDYQGQTALMTASAHGMTKVVHTVIKRGADVNIKDQEGKTALMYAISYSDEDTAYAILNHSKDLNLNAADYQGKTALMKAAIYEMTTIVSVLVQRGAHVNMTDIEGKSALFYALLGSDSSARCLVKNAADPQLKDNCSASVLTHFIRHCINNGMSSKTKLYDTFRFFEENGIKKQTIVNEIINIVFCKLPLLKIPRNVISKDGMLSLLLCAAQLSTERFSLRKLRGGNPRRYQLFQDLFRILDKVDTNITMADLSTALGILSDLVVDPNTCDEQGNDISQNIILLGLYNHSDKTKIVFDIFLWLEENGLGTADQTKCSNQARFHFMMSNAIKLVELICQVNMEFIVKMCKYFLQRDSKIAEQSSSSGESVFHLLIKLSPLDGVQEESFQQHLIDLLEMFKTHIAKLNVIINNGDDERNTPLHAWAASPHGLSADILHLLLSYGSLLQVRNMKGETPLHVCRTWTAVEKKAKPKDEDASGRSPLLCAAQNSLFLERPGFFYPDVPPDESPTFWRTVMDMGFDLWTCDENGDSIINNLIKGNSFQLAESLIEIACDNSKILSDETLLGMLNALCKDDSSQTTSKSILVGKLLTSIRRPLDVSAPLRSCCINIKKVVDGNSSESNSVHHQIAKQLLNYRHDSAESCLDVADGCPALQALLSTQICIDDVPLIIPWTTVSKRYETILAGVARRQNCKDQGPYWYHNEYIASGAFGHVFVGINTKDGMEVAIKKINNLKKKSKEDLREISTFAALPECDHIVRYLNFLDTTDFSYIIMELMEGNLKEYLNSQCFNQKEHKKLCEDLALGLRYLHEQNIIHRDLKPTNILFRTHPEFRLKIADFGLSRRLDINASSTVMVTGVGTLGWIAPEVLKSTKHEYSSDVFSLGLIFYYILANQRHPFSPADCNGKSYFEIKIATDNNVLHDIREEGWDNVLDPDSSDLITHMLSAEKKERPTASTLLNHPIFWSKTKKLDFLCGVGNQEEFECPRTNKTVLLTMVEQDLEKEFATIVEFGRWDDPRYTQTSVILTELKRSILRPDGSRKPIRKNYNYRTVVELVRFIRIAKAHVSEPSRPTSIKKQILEAVFLDEFPNLVIEVFKVVTKHTWDVTREEITYDLSR